MNDNIRHLIEGGIPLSRLNMWTLQREYYQRRGVAAWSSGEVPHSITNNPAHARAYLNLVLGFLRDVRPQLDLSQPVYLVELGAGSGRHAYMWNRELDSVKLPPPLEGVKFCYVLSDGARPNLDFWGRHPQFAELKRSGRLDFAELQLNRDGWQLDLEVSGVRLRPGAQANPMIFLANYVLDSLEQDVFRVENGQLLESRVSIYSPSPLSEEEPWPELATEYEHHPIVAEGYYPKPDWSSLLASYGHFKDTHLSLPLGGLHCVDEMHALSGGRYLFLAADKAWLEEEELADLDPPGLVVHGGCFSLTVNFHAMARYVERFQHGGAWLNAWRDSEIHLGCWTSLGPDLPELALAFQEHVCRVGPSDLFRLRELVEEQVRTPALRLCIEVLRLSQWDPDLLYDYSHPMVAGLDEATPETIKELEHGLLEVWRRYFHIGEERDIPFEIARLFYQMDRYALARLFFGHSMRLFGIHPMSVYNLGLCFYYEGDKAAALKQFKRAVRLGYAPAREWVHKLRAVKQLTETR